MKNIDKLIKKEKENLNKKDLYGPAKRRANKDKTIKVSSAQIEAWERQYWNKYNKI